MKHFQCLNGIVFDGVLLQVKPLLQVTNTEEKLNKKESELRQVTEHLTHLRDEHETLKNEHQQLASDKMIITEQLRAEQDLCAETEEVLCMLLFRIIHYIFSFVSLFLEFHLQHTVAGWLGGIVLRSSDS